MGYIEPTLSLVVGSVLSLYLFSLLPLSELVLFKPSIKAFPASLAKFKAMVLVAAILLYYFALGLIAPILIAPLFFPFLSYFLFSTNLN